MGKSLPNWPVLDMWSRVFLAVTLPVFVLLAGVWSVTQTVSAFSALLVTGLGVGLCLSIPALYYWHVSMRGRTRQVAVVDKW